MPLPKPAPITTAQPRRCWTCTHPWANDWLEDVLLVTKEAGHPRPTVPGIQRAMAAYHAEHGEKHGLVAPPTNASILNHLGTNQHSPRWNGWNE